MMTSERFLSNACHQTLAAIEDDYAARMEAAVADACAHLSIQNLEDEIAEISARRNGTSYCLIHSIASQENDSGLLMQLRGELNRRLRIKIAADDEAIFAMTDVMDARRGCVSRDVGPEMVAALADALGVPSSMAEVA